jgi:hypothetical protein
VQITTQPNNSFGTEVIADGKGRGWLALQCMAARTAIAQLTVLHTEHCTWLAPRGYLRRRQASQLQTRLQATNVTSLLLQFPLLYSQATCTVREPQEARQHSKPRRGTHMRTILHWGLLQTSCAMSLPAAGGTCTRQEDHLNQHATSERDTDRGQCWWLRHSRHSSIDSPR